MADPNHYGLAGPFSISELSRHIGAEIAGAAKAELVIVDVRSLEDAEPNHLSFLTNKRYTDAFRQSRAGAAIVGAGWASDAPDGMTLLVSEDPHLAFAKTTRLFYPPPRRRSGISPSAIIEENAILGDDVWIAPNAVIGTGARIGSGTKIGANSVIGDYAIVGKDCDIEANVTLSHCVIGDRVTIYPGVRIGQDGFGFATDRSIGDHLRIPQVGLVIIGNGASIGSNTTIDRGSGPDTIIGPGCMIDNLVQIGHNVVLGRGCVLAAQSGVAGSTKLGDFVMVGGQVGLAGHINIGSAAKVAGKSGVMQDVPPRAIIGGIPAVPMVQWLRHNLILEKLARRRDK